VKRVLRRILPAALTAALAAIAAVAIYIVRVLNAPPGRAATAGYTFSPFETDVAWEPVEFNTDDGLTLRGWFFPRPETARVVVGLTGHKGAKSDLLGIGSGLWRAGFNVLLFDYRGLGGSDPAPLSLAHHELIDTRAAIAFARRRVEGASVGLIGYSMGAALAILAAARDSDVRGVVADASFASVHDVVGDSLARRWFLPVWPLLPLSDLLNRRLHGYSFRAVSPIDAITSIAPRPILIIHGTADGIVPVEHAHRLYRAAGPGTDLWITTAGHCGTYFLDRPAYVQRVATFFERVL
jgi:uncharacterized protein